MKRFLRALLCSIGHHAWTTAAEQGIKPTIEQLSNPFVGFWEYAAMFCKHCGKESEISKEERRLHRRADQ